MAIEEPESTLVSGWFYLWKYFQGNIMVLGEVKFWFFEKP